MIQETMRLHELIHVEDELYNIEWLGFNMHKVDAVYRSNLVGRWEDFETVIKIGDHYHTVQCGYEWFWRKYTEFVQYAYIKVGFGNITLN